MVKRDGSMMDFGSEDSQSVKKNELPTIRETELRDTEFGVNFQVSNIAGADISYLVERIDDFTLSALKLFSDSSCSD